MNTGVNIKIINKAVSEPYRVKTTASWAMPFLSIWWPGNVERKLSSSGAPRKIEGIKLTKEFVITIEVIKIIRATTEKNCNDGDRAIIEAAIRFV